MPLWYDARAETHLILGGGGFIGRHVARQLAEAGAQVILANRRGACCSFPPALMHRITWKRFEMAAADYDALIAGVDVVHHFAWTSIPATANADPAADLTVNVGGTLRLLDAVRRQPAPPRVVFCSSGGTVYARLQQVPVAEDHPLAPITAYGAAKAAVELYLETYRALYGLDCRVARMSNPFGTGQNLTRGQGAVSVFLAAALEERPITIWGDGEVVRDYVHVADAAAGWLRLARAPRSDGPWKFNIASGHGVSLNEIIRGIETQLERKLVVIREPGRAFDVPVSVLDCTLARTTLDWVPLLSFAEGLQRTIVDLQEMHALQQVG